jgi:hypothetical protein
LKAGRDGAKKWKRYAAKSDPGASGERFSDDSGAAEAGPINSGESFFTLPTPLSTFHAVVLSAMPRIS